MSDTSYDVIIIGGGLAGLTCAALLAKQGKKIVLLEKNRRLGGYATSYGTKGHSFDVATQALGGCEPEGPVFKVLDELSLSQEISFLNCEPARAYYFNDSEKPYIQHGNWQDQLGMLNKLFPGHKDALSKCFHTWHVIYKELQEIASQPHQKTAFNFTKKFPFLARYGRATVKDFFEELSIPSQLQRYLAARASYCLLPLNKLSLIGFACTEISYANGAWMVEGGVKKLPEFLAQGLKKHGGIVKTNTTVTAIHTDNNSVTGVETSIGELLFSKKTVIACDAQKALQQWLQPQDILPKGYIRKFQRMRASGSYYVSYYSVPEEAVNSMYPNIEVRNNPSEYEMTDEFPVYYILIPSLVDKSSAPKGRHSFCLSVPLPPGKLLDKSERKNIRQKLEKIVEQKFPALKGEMSWLFELSPMQLAAMTGNVDGSAYGWAQTPEQAGIYRLNIQTPVQGMYLAGHWTMPGGGIAGVVISGQLCAQAILRDSN